MLNFNKNTNRNFKNLYIVMISELKSKLNAVSLVMMFMSWFISMLPIFLIGEFSVNAKGPISIENQTWSQIARAYSTVVMWATGLSLFSILRDNSTLDKNRLTYLRYNKSSVLLGKIFADTVVFFATIMFVVILAPIFLVNLNHGKLIDGAISKITLYVIGFLFFYILIVMGMRFIDSKNKKKLNKGLFMSLWLLFTVVAFIASSILIGIKFNDYKDWFIDHKILVSFIPILNITTPFLILYDLLPLWSAVPLITYSVIGIIVFWKPLSSSLKEYLTI